METTRTTPGASIKRGGGTCATLKKVIPSPYPGGFLAVLPIKGFQKPMDDDAFDIRRRRRSEMIGVSVLFPRQMNKEEEEEEEDGKLAMLATCR